MTDNFSCRRSSGNLLRDFALKRNLNFGLMGFEAENAFKINFYVKKVKFYYKI